MTNIQEANNFHLINSPTRDAKQADLEMEPKNANHQKVENLRMTATITRKF